MEFKSAKTKADILGLKKHLGLPDNYLIWESRAEVVVEFIANINAKSWGISGITATATSVTGSIDYECDHDDPKQREGTIDIKAFINGHSGWKIKDDIRCWLDGELLSVTQVVIDFDTKEISIA